MDWVTTTKVLEALKTSADGIAWRMFHNHFYPVLLKFGRKLGLADPDAEDAAQETMIAFLNAYRNGRYDRTKGRLSHWLFGVAKNVLIERRRKVQSSPERPIADRTGADGSFWDLVKDDATSTLERMWDDEWRSMVLKKCLARVRGECDERTFQAFDLYAMSELPVDQVAQRLSMSPNAVYIAKNRVLARLRQLEHEFDTLDEGPPA